MEKNYDVFMNDIRYYHSLPKKQAEAIVDMQKSHCGNRNGTFASKQRWEIREQD